MVTTLFDIFRKCVGSVESKEEVIDSTFILIVPVDLRKSGQVPGPCVSSQGDHLVNVWAGNKNFEFRFVKTLMYKTCISSAKK